MDPEYTALTIHSALLIVQILVSCVNQQANDYKIGEIRLSSWIWFGVLISLFTGFDQNHQRLQQIYPKLHLLTCILIPPLIEVTQLHHAKFYFNISLFIGSIYLLWQ